MFPGLAIAEALQEHDCRIMLLISPKPVDQEAVKTVRGMEIVTIPAVALQGGEYGKFFAGSLKSLRLCAKVFRTSRPRAVLGMGGFTSAPPALAGKMAGAATFLHEANSIPGRANRLLAPWVDHNFVGFPQAAARLKSQSVAVTGTPVRSQFTPGDAASCRMALGLDPKRPVLFAVGGSQGAVGLNRAVSEAAPLLKELVPDLQFLHLTGETDRGPALEAYAKAGCRAVVLPFLSEMEMALGAATVAISRAGASAIAEFAAMRVPSILIPFPAAADNHQFYNAQAVVSSGAARMFEQKSLAPAALAQAVAELVLSSPARETMSAAWGQWQFPHSAQDIARRILGAIGAPLKEAPELPDADAGERPPNFPKLAAFHTLANPAPNAP